MHLVKSEQNSKVFVSMSENDDKRGTFDEGLERCISCGSRSTRDMFTRDVNYNYNYTRFTLCYTTPITLPYATPHHTTVQHATTTTTAQLQLQLHTLHYTEVRLHCTRLHCTRLRYSTLLTRHYNYTYDYNYNTSLHYSTLHSTPLHSTTPRCTTRHGTTPHDTTLHYTTQDHTTLHYATLSTMTAQLHYTTLDYTTHTTLHYMTLHCTQYTTPQLRLQLH